MQRSTTSLSSTLLALLAGAALMAGCNRPNDTTTARADAPAVQAERSAEQAADKARDAAREAGQSVGQAADAVGNKARDVAITTEVNMRLARDPSLSALGINVDTSEGRVVLRGSAPDTAARTRASELARGVDGVRDVVNELSVQPRN